MIRPVQFEYAELRPIREHNTVIYRVAHWPLWITVFFLSPGPVVFELFSVGPTRRTLTWLATVMLGTGTAGVFGELPGVEPRPYILKFTEDKPNPLYRRICYTFAWNVVINYVALNLAGLVYASLTGRWVLPAIYRRGYFPIAALVWGLGLSGNLPRVGASTKGEGVERRYFYGSVWAACVAQPLLGVLWKALPSTRTTTVVKLGIFVGTLAAMGVLAAQGKLLRTRPILPGEVMVAD